MNEAKWFGFMYLNQFVLFVLVFFVFLNLTEIMTLQQGGLHVARAGNMWKLCINVINQNYFHMAYVLSYECFMLSFY